MPRIPSRFFKSLVQDLRDLLGITEKKALLIIYTVFNCISSALIRGETFSVRGVGYFYTYTRPAFRHWGRLTQSVYITPAKRIAAFRPSPSIILALQGT